MIAAHGYDAPTHTMVLQFRGGGTYHYNGVAPERYQQFAAAESHGKHFAAHIKGKFPEKRIQ